MSAAADISLPPGPRNPKRVNAALFLAARNRAFHRWHQQYGDIFFVDIAGHVQDEAMKKAIAQLDASAQEVKVLGSYPVAVL